MHMCQSYRIQVPNHTQVLNVTMAYNTAGMSITSQYSRSLCETGELLSRETYNILTQPGLEAYPRAQLTLKHHAVSMYMVPIGYLAGWSLKMHGCNKSGAIPGLVTVCRHSSSEDLEAGGHNHPSNMWTRAE